MKPTFKRLRESLFAATDGVEVCDAINALAKHAATGESDAKAILADYSLHGPVHFQREFACSMLAGIVDSSDEALGDVFRQGLMDDATRYWSILGFQAICGEEAYPALATIVADESLPVEDRAHAVKCLASASRQPFDRELPSDPGNWQAADLRLDEVVEWLEAGAPRGAGHGVPTRHASLDAPQTALEKIASRLDKRLAKKRIQGQDAANPTDWLAEADPQDLAQLGERWQFPAVYLDFLTRFSPLQVILSKRRYPNGGLHLFGAGELLSAQGGYAYDSTTGASLADWPEDYVVIASHGGDPFVLDLAGSDGHEAPILTAEHGTGTWEFERVADSFTAFLTTLVR